MSDGPNIGFRHQAISKGGNVGSHCRPVYDNLKNTEDLRGEMMLLTIRRWQQATPVELVFV